MGSDVDQSALGGRYHHLAVSANGFDEEESTQRDAFRGVRADLAIRVIGAVIGVGDDEGVVQTVELVQR